MAMACISPAQGDVEIDLAESNGPAEHRASGFLWALTADTPADELIRPLKPQLYRSRLTPWIKNSGLQSLSRMDAMGARLQVVLSDEYALRFKYIKNTGWGTNEDFGYSNVTDWPGDNGDYALWNEVIEECFNRVKTAGLSVQWDIWEEPNWRGWWAPGKERFFETYAHAYRKLKSLDPDAEIVAPSINRYQPDFLHEFLLYAKKHDVLPDVLSWHEILQVHGPVNLARHVSEVRNFMQEHDIDIEHIDINEVIPPEQQTNPGIHAWYFAYMEQAGIHGACRACWMDEQQDVYNAWNPMLGGLLTHPDGNPRSTWWVYKAYADITGTLVEVKRDRSMAGLAGIDAENKTVRILLGRSGNAFQGNDIHIVNLDAVPWLFEDGNVRVMAKRIPNRGWKALAEPITLTDETVRVTNDKLTLTFPGFKQHEALTIELVSPKQRTSR